MTDPASPEIEIGPAPCPRLAPGARLQVDQLTGQVVLLFPEGMLQLNSTGSAILELCDGHRSLQDVARALSPKYCVAPESLQKDIAEYLDRLRQRRLVMWDGAATNASDKSAQHANQT
jgi:pyrroloquinoline quinone biosynthesis protein D